MKPQEKVRRFEKKMGWNRTPAKKIMVFLQADAFEMKQKNLKHKLTDVYFETLQLANRKKINLDKALEKHMKAAEKKYRK